MEKIRRGREKRASLWEQMKALVEQDEMSAEDLAKYDQLEADFSKVSKDIKRLEDHLALGETVEGIDPADRAGIIPGANASALGVRGADSPDVYATAFSNWMRRGGEGITAEQRNLLMGAAMDPRTVQNALGIGSSTAGGYTVPQGFRDELIETMKYFGGVQQNAQVLFTDSGQPLPWPTVNDVANKGAILSENTGISQQDIVFGQGMLNAYMYTSLLVLVSWQLLQDSAVDVQQYLSRALGERIGRIWNDHFTTGTGSAQPLGVQTNATIGKTGLTGQTTSLIYDDLVDLIYSVDPAYRGSGRCKFMMNDSSMAVVRKLKDTQGHPLWEPGVQLGQPDSLLGYALVTNNSMPAMAANAKSVLFGDYFSAYVIRIVNDVSLVRLNERYADALQVGFFAFARADATLQQPAAVRAYANSAT